MKKVKIFIATHKEYNFPKKEGYIPIHCGSSSSNLNLPYLKDNKNDNISKKNSNYCELTALYYAWKNEKNIDVIGLCHYRRYFYQSILFYTKQNIISIKKVLQILNKYDIILPLENYIPDKKTVRDKYNINHHAKDLLKCEEIIKEKYPDYLQSFETIMNRNYCSHYNMFIMKKKDFDNYCNWLFNILFELEKQTDVSSYDNYNKRIYGFIAERLLNVWVLQNKLKIKRLPVYNIESKRIKQIGSTLKQIILIFINKILKTKNKTS